MISARAGAIRTIGRSRPVTMSRTSRARTSRLSPTSTSTPVSALRTAKTRQVSPSICRSAKPDPWSDSRCCGAPSDRPSSEPDSDQIWHDSCRS